MSDLTAKFSQVLDQMAATNALLQSIIDAMTAPPPSNTTTLADLELAIAATNNRLDTLIAAIGASNAELQAIDTKNASILGNTQQMLTGVNSLVENVSQMAIVQEQFNTHYFSGVGTYQLLENLTFGVQGVRNTIIDLSCPCGIDGPILPAPGNMTPFPSEQDQERCRRIQKFLDWFLYDVLHRVRQLYTAYGFVGAAALGVALSAALVALAPETLGSSLIPAVAITAIVAMLGQVASIGIAELTDNFTDNVKNTLITNLYESTEAVGMKTVFDSTIDQFTEIPDPVRAIWKALALQVFFDQLLDPNHQIDTTGYDGTICAPEPPPPERNIGTMQVQFYNGQWWETTEEYVALFGAPISGEKTWNTVEFGWVSDEVYAAGNYNGWVIDNGTDALTLIAYTGAATTLMQNTPFQVFNISAGTALTIPIDTTYLYVYSGGLGGSFRFHNPSA